MAVALCMVAGPGDAGAVFFVDNFVNDDVTRSDSHPGFWGTHTESAAGSIRENIGNDNLLTLSTGDGDASAQGVAIYSAPRSEFDFFRAAPTNTFTVRRINMSGTGSFELKLYYPDEIASIETIKADHGIDKAVWGDGSGATAVRLEARRAGTAALTHKVTITDIYVQDVPDDHVKTTPPPGVSPTDEYYLQGMLNAQNPPYHCVGDGATDNSIALQSAINDAIEHNLILYIPRGTYVVGRTMYFMQKVYLRDQVSDGELGRKIALNLGSKVHTVIGERPPFRPVIKLVTAEPITLGADTKLFGAGIASTSIVQAIQTVDSKVGTAILSQMRVPGITWRVGRDSMIRNVSGGTVRASGSGGGRWFGVYPRLSGSSQSVLVSGTTEPLHIYNMNVERINHEPQSEIRDAMNVFVYGTKGEILPGAACSMRPYWRSRGPRTSPCSDMGGCARSPMTTSS